jgi:regulator of sigma E protease
MLESMTTTQSFLALVLGFGFIIFIHELGHFLVAKAVGIKCTQFAIGFGQALLCYRKGVGVKVGTTEPQFEKRIREQLNASPDEHLDEEAIERTRVELNLGETEYRFNWMPLGGYVKMLGQEDLDPTAVSENPRSFSNKPAWARAAVISAGVIMNLIFAMVFFVVAFSLGVEFPRNVVGAVTPDAPAAQTYAMDHQGESDYRGLSVGDRIIEIDGEPTNDFMDVQAHTALARGGESIRMVVERHGQAEPLVFDIMPRVGRMTGLLSVGIEPTFTLTLRGLDKDGDLYKAGVRPGMRLVEVDGTPVNHYADYFRITTAARGMPVAVVFSDEETSKRVATQIEALPLLSYHGATAANLLGFVPVTRIELVVEDKPAAQAGIRVGDILARVGAIQWPTAIEVKDEILRFADRGDAVPVTVWRDGATVQLPSIQPAGDRMIGIAPMAVLDEPIVGRTMAGSPAAAMELNPMSRITSINAAAVSGWTDIQRLLQLATAAGSDNAQVRIGYELNIVDRPTGEQTVALDAEAVRRVREARWTEPIIFEGLFDQDKQLVQAESLTQAITIGFEKTHQFMVQTYVTLARLFQGTVKPRHLKGPVGIVDIGTKVGRQGITYLLFFLGLISVNLVVINFLPIPIVDGGLMLFLIIEKIKGSPVHPRVLAAANTVGLVLIGGLFLMLTYFDLKDLFS